jgi:predicted nuclease with TOPRIM domain
MRTIKKQSNSLGENSEKTDFNNNYPELEQAFQQLQAKYQKICSKLKQMEDLNKDLHLEFQYHLENVYVPLKNRAEFLEDWLENFKTLMATFEEIKNANIKQEIK